MSGLDHILGMLILQTTYRNPQITNLFVCLIHTAHGTDQIGTVGKRLLVRSGIRCATDDCGIVISASFVGSR